MTHSGIRDALLDFVVDSSLVSDELVDARYAAASMDGAAERFRAVIAARDVDREQLPLDFSVLAALKVPVLLIHGREDRVIPLSRSLELAATIPHADLHFFSQCGHWSQVERAADFNKLVAAYLPTHS